jgi:hypothetical protein
MQEDENRKHAPASKPYGLTPSEIESLRQDALKMDEVAKAYFGRRSDEDAERPRIGPRGSGVLAELRQGRNTD